MRFHSSTTIVRGTSLISSLHRPQALPCIPPRQGSIARNRWDKCFRLQEESLVVHKCSILTSWKESKVLEHFPSRCGMECLMTF